MRRRILRGLCGCAAALLALLALAVALSHAIWGRSLPATVYERVLARRNATTRTAETEIERLEAKRQAGETEYAMPESMRFSVSQARERRESGDAGEWINCYVLNGDAHTQATVFYMHGGAYINSFNHYHWRLLDRLAREAGVQVIAPEYHVAPFGNCLRAHRDITALYADYVKANPGRRILLMGDSAGGGLALALTEAWAGLGLPLPERLILFSPWVDVTMENPDIMQYLAVEPILHLDLVKVHGRYWADDIDPHDWRASPLFGDLSGLPPMTVYAGTRELLWPDICLLMDALAEADVEADFRVGTGLNHDFPLMPLPEGRRAVNEVIALCRGEDR